MRNPREIKQEIDEVTERRSVVLRLLSESYTTELADEHKGLDEHLAALWDEHRHARVAYSFGDRSEIIQRARHDERLTRAA